MIGSVANGQRASESFETFADRRIDESCNELRVFTLLKELHPLLYDLPELQVGSLSTLMHTWCGYEFDPVCESIEKWAKRYWPDEYEADIAPIIAKHKRRRTEAHKRTPKRKVTL